MAKKTAKKWPDLETRISRIKGLIASSQNAVERSNRRIERLQAHLARIEQSDIKKKSEKAQEV